jgi:peptide chain release factor 1
MPYNNILSPKDFSVVLKLKDLALSVALRVKISEFVQSYENSLKESPESEETFEKNNLAKILELEREIIKNKESKNITIEIRAGAGGDEGGIFAADLAGMYNKYALSQGWKVKLLYPEGSLKNLKSCKECVFTIAGEGVDKLCSESGVHRVQRVPKTEKKGRIHTSTASVVVFSEKEKKKVEINTRDLEITACKASGAGGQHVNTTDSAIRIRHKPSGLVVTSQSERSQHQNRQIALEKLKQKLILREMETQDKQTQSLRRSSIGGAGRHEKIRSYNAARNRIVDHRVGKKNYNLKQSLMEGKISKMISDCYAFANEQYLRELKSRIQ